MKKKSVSIARNRDFVALEERPQQLGLEVSWADGADGVRVREAANRLYYLEDGLIELRDLGDRIVVLWAKVPNEGDVAEVVAAITEDDGCCPPVEHFLRRTLPIGPQYWPGIATRPVTPKALPF